MTTPFIMAALSQQAYTIEPTWGRPDAAGRAVLAQVSVDLHPTVAFPGSDDLSCWEHDFEFIPEEVPDLGRVHSGIYQAWLEVKEPVIATAPRYVTGHSLGAGLAIIAAAALCVAGTPPVAVFGFAPPRVSTDAEIGTILKAHGVGIYLYRYKCESSPRPWGCFHDSDCRSVGCAVFPTPVGVFL